MFIFVETLVLAEILGGLATLAGVIFLVFAAINFFIARGLWKGQEWSRILILIFCWIFGVLSILSIFTGGFAAIILVAIYGLIIWYLQFKKEVKTYFSS
jgi:uncharacterized membrane protein (DUF2068 family)